MDFGIPADRHPRPGLTEGTRIASYEIRSSVGAGGMGEVYRATDLKLGRDVAIKVLPAIFSADADRLARFEREAHVLAALNHPNIAAIYGLEESDGLKALVLELIPGETLADRVARGPIRLDEALVIGRQITAALAAAHDQGIVHRDLKPANIKITPDGVVKVLDFGLAKVAGSPAQASPMSMSPTITSPAMMTGVGVLLGTAPYMSPEQAKGRDADKRADIWAFGAVLYEMVTGQRAFGGEDVTSTLAKVLESEPRWDDLPIRVRRLIRRCLEKNEKNRLRDIADVWDLLDEERAHEPSRRASAPWVWLAIGAAIVAMAAVIPEWRPAAAADVPAQFFVELPQGVVPTAGLALSPDGRKLAYCGAKEGASRSLYVYHLESAKTESVAGSEGCGSTWSGALLWSPDSRDLLYTTARQLRRVDPAGGHGAVVVTDSPSIAWGWLNSEEILVTSAESGLARVSAQGSGKLIPLTRLDAAMNEVAHGNAMVLADKRHIAFQAGSPEHFASYGPQPLYATTVGSSERTPLGLFPIGTAFAPSGYLIFVRDDGLIARPVDGEGSASAGPGTNLIPELSGPSIVSAADNGTLAVLNPVPEWSSQTRVVSFDRSGRMEELANFPAGQYIELELSPDERRLALTETKRNGFSLATFELQSGIRQTLTADSTLSEGFVRYSSDGKWMVFQRQATSTQGATFSLILKATSGGNEEILFTSRDAIDPVDFTPDGRGVAVARVNGDVAGADIELQPIEGGRARRPLLGASPDSREKDARFSPDRSWVVYTSDYEGRFEVYLDALNGTVKRQRVSDRGGVQPRWSADGKEIFYLDPDGGLMAVQIVRATPSQIQTDSPRRLFETRLAPDRSGFPTSDYAVTKDGMRFYVFQRPSAKPAIRVIQNWERLLKKD